MRRKPRVVQIPGLTTHATGYEGRKGASAEQMAAVRASRVARRWSAEETQRQLAAVEAMMREGFPSSRIIEQLRKPPPTGMGLSRSRCRKLIDRIDARWREEDDSPNRRAKMRSAAERRLLSGIQRAKGREDPNNPGRWLERPNHSAIARYEKLLMDLQGTAAPLEVNVSVEVRESLMLVFSQYTLEDLERMHEQAERRHRLAREYASAHPNEVLDEDRALLLLEEGTPEEPTTNGVGPNGGRNR